MNKKVAIVQSSYIPWKGYFDLINMVDEFILYDDVQFTRRDWRNRNIIKTPNGSQWITIPVEVKGKYLQLINETKISDTSWAQNHWKTLSFNYKKANFFNEYAEIISAIYTHCEQENYLSQVNYYFLKEICKLLNINTQLTWSTDYSIDTQLKKTERLVALCQAANATHYISGPSAQNYMQADLFEKANITLSYIEYSAYPPYSQLFGEFDHAVTILDLLFNQGPQAKNYMKSFS